MKRTNLQKEIEHEVRALLGSERKQFRAVIRGEISEMVREQIYLEFKNKAGMAWKTLIHEEASRCVEEMKRAPFLTRSDDLSIRRDLRGMVRQQVLFALKDLVQDAVRDRVEVLTHDVAVLLDKLVGKGQEAAEDEKFRC